MFLSPLSYCWLLVIVFTFFQTFRRSFIYASVTFILFLMVHFYFRCIFSFFILIFFSVFFFFLSVLAWIQILSYVTFFLIQSRFHVSLFSKLCICFFSLILMFLKYFYLNLFPYITAYNFLHYCISHNILRRTILSIYFQFLLNFLFMNGI